MSESKLILYVEDNFENRLLVRRLLNAYGYDVFEAENAEEAFSCVRSYSPSLILMDINMPNIDGYTLTKEIKKFPNLVDTPILAITANVMKGDRQKSLQAGCDGYIEKPINVDTFIDQIEQYIS
jgi:two-component system cell cycle response regulator DivK